MDRSDLLRLLHACKQEPDDATAHLVLADWLEEHGDADRAAFVRLDAAPGIPEFPWLRKRRWTENAARWMPFAGSLGKRPDPSPSRGLASVRATLAGLSGLLAQEIAASEKWAWVERLSVGLSPKRLEQLTESPLLAGVPCLELVGDRMGPEAAALLAGWPGRARLRRLDLEVSALAPDEAAILLGSPHGAGLRALRVPHGAVTASGRPGTLPALEELDVRSGASAFVSLVGSAAWRLRSLSLNAYSEPGLGTLAQADALAGLRRLRLGSLGYGTDEARTVASARWWGTLEEATLAWTRLNAEDAARFAAMPEAPRLRAFSFQAYTVDPGALTMLARSPLFAAPDRLELRGPMPDAAPALASLAAAPRTLALLGPELGDEGAALLARWPGLERCRALTLQRAGIGPQGIAALAES
ncbi:MAG: TIGR02996 domain-containing protein, partial [Gemmataceae bacterium]|nr:TIGR02996 domain-containing protein [Gemmataceae bacterium]